MAKEAFPGGEPSPEALLELADDYGRSDSLGAVGKGQAAEKGVDQRRLTGAIASGEAHPLAVGDEEVKRTDSEVAALYNSAGQLGNEISTALCGGDVHL